MGLEKYVDADILKDVLPPSLFDISSEHVNVAIQLQLSRDIKALLKELQKEGPEEKSKPIRGFGGKDDYSPF